MNNITDDIIDQIQETIEDKIVSYFDEVSVNAPKSIKKGPANPLKWHSPSIFILPESTQRVDRYIHRVSFTVGFLIRDNDGGRLAKTIARGADAIAQLLVDNYSTENVSYDFEYALSEGTQEAAASISATVVI